MSTRSRQPQGGKFPQASPIPQQPSLVSTRTRMLWRVVTVPNGATIGVSSGAATGATRNLSIVHPFNRISMRTGRGSFDGSGDASGRYPSLDRKEKQKDRQRRDDGRRHDRAPVDIVVAEELVEAQRQGLEVGLRQEGERKQIFRPAQQEGISSGRHEARQHDRADDQPDNLPPRGAVNDGGFVEALRYGHQIANE